MTKLKRILVVAMTLAIAFLFLCPAFASAAVGDNYLYDITNRLDIKDSQCNQPSGVAQGYPLTYTMVVLAGSHDDWSYSYYSNSADTDPWVTGSSAGVFHSDSLTYVILSGDDDWYALRYGFAPLAIYLIVDNSLTSAQGTFSIGGQTADFGNRVYFSYSSPKPYEYNQKLVTGSFSTVAHPLADNYCLYITGCFTDIINFNLSDSVPYTVCYSCHLTLTPEYSFSFDGQLTDQVVLSGTSHQTGSSTLHDGDLIMELTAVSKSNGEYITGSAWNNSDVEIVVPDSNVDLSGTISLDSSDISATGIPINAIKGVNTSAVIYFDQIPTGSFTMDIGIQAGSDITYLYAVPLSISATYQLKELPQSQSAYLGSIYRALYKYVNDFDERIVQSLQTSWAQIQKPFYKEWFEKFVAIFDRGADEEAKSDFSQAEDKLNEVSAGLAQSPQLDTGSVEFNAPTLDQDNLLLVVINQAWDVPFYLQCVAVLVGCVVLSFLLFGKKG